MSNQNVSYRRDCADCEWSRRKNARKFYCVKQSKQFRVDGRVTCKLDAIPIKMTHRKEF